jgi:hypothetical protein
MARRKPRYETKSTRLRTAGNRCARVTSGAQLAHTQEEAPAGISAVRLRNAFAPNSYGPGGEPNARALPTTRPAVDAKAKAGSGLEPVSDLAAGHRAAIWPGH